MTCREVAVVHFMCCRVLRISHKTAICPHPPIHIFRGDGIKLDPFLVDEAVNVLYFKKI
jgi:hypothetical protein